MGLAPIIALAWTGCADDEGATGYGPIYVDPGGTFGAEFSINVVGRGRVQTSGPEIDCPSACFAKYIFKSSTADGAAGALSLKATPTAGSRFAGWSFSTDPVGTRGRGSANCNPVLRPGADPQVDRNALEIELPYGETAGTPPAGKESACQGQTTVPLIYNVTATFVTDPPVELDAGSDAGSLEVAYTAPAVGAIGREVGLTANGYLYWHYQTGGLSGIAYDSNPSTGGAPQTASVIVPVSSTSFTLFEVDPYGVVYQATSGAISVIRYGLTSPTTMGGSPPTCNALAVDSSYNVYCRTASTIVQWTYPSYTTGNILYSGLPSGTDLHAESSGGSLYYSSTSSSALLSLPITGADGSVASPTTVVSGSFGAVNLEANSSRFFWIDPSGSVRASSSKFAPASPYDTQVPPSTSFRHLAQDPNSTAHFWVASSSAIYHAYYFGDTGPGVTEPLRTGLSGIAGMTADSSYVYISQTDGTIRRVSTSEL